MRIALTNISQKSRTEHLNVGLPALEIEKTANNQAISDTLYKFLKDREYQ